VSTSPAFHGFTLPFARATEIPHDVSDALLRLAAANDAHIAHADVQESGVRRARDGEPYFEIYRANEVMLTSILFSGGDWRWRFCSGAGVPIATSAGYANERECMAAVASLRFGAAAAVVRREPMQ